MSSTSATILVMVGFIEKLRAQCSIRRLAYSGVDDTVTVGRWEMLIEVMDIERDSLGVIVAIVMYCKTARRPVFEACW
jgi:hypothetical protein